MSDFWAGVRRVWDDMRQPVWTGRYDDLWVFLVGVALVVLGLVVGY